MIENFEQKGAFLCRDGKARSKTESYSNKKLCFVSTDKEFLMDLLLDLADHQECYFVKLTSKKATRDFFLAAA